MDAILYVWQTHHHQDCPHRKPVTMSTYIWTTIHYQGQAYVEYVGKLTVSSPIRHSQGIGCRHVGMGFDKSSITAAKF